jgi:hypothetical protein
MKTRSSVSTTDRQRVPRPLITVEAMAAAMARIRPQNEKRVYKITIGFCTQVCKQRREMLHPEYVRCG